MNNTKFENNFQKLTEKIGIKTNNKELYLKAFTHSSYANEHKMEKNERLEYLGDAILDFLVAEYLYINYPLMEEGSLSKLRSKYVCSQANYEYALELELDSCLLLGKGENEQGGSSKQSVLANLFEAFLGAMYLDIGLDEVRNLLKKYLFPHILTSKEDYFIDYKSKLQEYIQAESRLGVEYILENETGPNHDKTFTVSVFHEKIRLGTGLGKNKKEAEQKAAEDALSKCTFGI